MRFSRILTALFIVVLVGGASAYGSESSPDDQPGAGLIGNLFNRLAETAAHQAPPAPDKGATSTSDGSPTTTATGPQSHAAGAASQGEDVQSAAVPVAVDDAYTVAQDSGTTTLSPPIKANDSQPTEFIPNLTVVLDSNPTHGTVNAEGTTYTPAAGFNGTDSFTYHLSYADFEPEIIKVNQKTNTATVTITVTPAGPPSSTPHAVNDAYTVAQDSGATTLSPTIKANDTLPPEPYYISVFDAPHGTVSSDGTTYTPDAGFNGTDTFTYNYGYLDGSTIVLTNTATVTITVSPLTATPSAAVARDDVYTIEENTQLNELHVMANDSPGNSGGFYLPVIVTPPSHGHASAGNDLGLVIYEPDGDFTGTDTLTYRLIDASSDGPPSNTATVSIHVIPKGGSKHHSHHGTGDGDDDGDKRHHHHHGTLPDTGASYTPAGLAAGWLLTAAGSCLIIHPRRRTS